MTRLEMVEKIREKSGVTYDVAKEALEKSNWDILDALISLDNPNFTAAQAQAQIAHEDNASKRVHKKSNIDVSDVADKVSRCLKYVLKFINKGENIRLEITRKDEAIESVSLTVIVLLFLIKWWLPIGLLALGLATGFKYKLTGAGSFGEYITNRTNDKADELRKKMSEDKDEE